MNGRLGNSSFVVGEGLRVIKCKLKCTSHTHTHNPNCEQLTYKETVQFSALEVYDWFFNVNLWHTQTIKFPTTAH